MTNTPRKRSSFSRKTASALVTTPRKSQNAKPKRTRKNNTKVTESKRALMHYVTLTRGKSPEERKKIMEDYHATTKRHTPSKTTVRKHSPKKHSPKKTTAKKHSPKKHSPKKHSPKKHSPKKHSPKKTLQRSVRQRRPLQRSIRLRCIITSTRLRCTTTICKLVKYSS